MSLAGLGILTSVLIIADAACTRSLALPELHFVVDWIWSYQHFYISFSQCLDRELFHFVVFVAKNL
jgi:hypothetical protein